MDEELEILSKKAQEEGKSYNKKRIVFKKIESLLTERVFIGLIGPRGAGKTVILKQLLGQSEASFYLSLDAASLKTTLYSVADELEKRGIKYFLIDEIQFYPGFEKELKKIYDFLKIMVVFSGSAAISLSQGAYDLSRRARIISVSPFSFREFILFEKGEIPGTFSWESLLDKEVTRTYYGKLFHSELLFDDYLQGRLYPFTMNKKNYPELFGNMLERIITGDLLRAGFVQPDEIMDIRKLLKFMGNSMAEDVSYSSISQNCGVTKYMAEKYVSLLEKSFVLNQVFPKGTNVMKEPKILFSLPYRLLYKKFDDCMGALREDFFAEAMRFSGIEIFYLKTNRGEKTPDYLVKDTVVEIGGKGKGRSQFKGIKASRKIILTHPGAVDQMKRPLFLVGMLE